MIYFGMVICQSISFSILFMSLCMSPNLYNSRLSMKQDCIQSESEVTQSRLTLCDPWTVVGQAPLSMGFSRQEYWSGLPFPSPRNLPDPGIEPESPVLQADSLPSELPGNPSAPLNLLSIFIENSFRAEKSLFYPKAFQYHVLL